MQPNYFPFLKRWHFNIHRPSAAVVEIAGIHASCCIHSSSSWFYSNWPSALFERRTTPRLWDAAAVENHRSSGDTENEPKKQPPTERFCTSLEDSYRLDYTYFHTKRKPAKSSHSHYEMRASSAAGSNRGRQDKTHKVIS